MAEDDQKGSVVMFAEIVGSAQLYEEMGDALGKAVVDNVLASVADVTEKHGGSVIKYVGDEALCWFQDPNEACVAAIEMQEATLEYKEDIKDLKIKIGLQYGPVIERAGDIFGDTVNVAARMAGVATDGQIVTTEHLTEQLTDDLQAKCRVLERARVKGKAHAINIVVVLWESTEDVTTMDGKVFPDTKLEHQSMSLTVGSVEYVVTSDRLFTIGRGRTCDLTTTATLASRQHASIEFKHGRFVLVDQSTNGTYVRAEDGNLIYLRREEMLLWGQGVISLGSDFEEGEECHIHYAIT